jgi:sorbitol-specific phosphotransferase system component IIBC
MSSGGIKPNKYAPVDAPKLGAARNGCYTMKNVKNVQILSSTKKSEEFDKLNNTNFSSHSTTNDILLFSNQNPQAFTC